MLKLVDIHASATVQGEYVVLQNLGVVAVSLRGWALCTDAYFGDDVYRMAAQMFVFRDDVAIKPHTRIVLFTGCGDDGWMPTTDGREAYCAYWNRKERIWSVADHIHVLHLLASRRLRAPEPAVPVLAAAKL